jgi:glycosyltransferase involved in cell wall biosynthesis
MLVVVIPAYNEEKTIEEAVRGAKQYCDKVIVINDGSSDKTEEKARLAGALVLSHLINRRYTLGAALQTGIKAALLLGADIIVTFDADLQHNPLDIPRIAQPIIEKKAEATIGSRFAQSLALSNAPHRRLGGIIANLLTWFLYGHYVSDSQSGLRAFSRNAALKINLKSSRMEVSSEIIGEIFRHNLKLIEIPINPIYTPYALSKGQNFRLGIKTAWWLIMRRLTR